MREVCAFTGMGGKNGRFVFDEPFVSHLVYLLILYLCIYWILFMSFWIFVLVFSGVVVRLVSADRVRGVVLQIKTRRCQTNVPKQNQNLKTVVT